MTTNAQMGPLSFFGPLENHDVGWDATVPDTYAESYIGNTVQ